MKKTDIIVHWNCLKKEFFDGKDDNAINGDHKSLKSETGDISVLKCPLLVSE